jgi:shikimate kinase
MRESRQPIIITGFMGAGKTTVAQALAERLGCRMLDLDEFIGEREGRTAQVIIDEDGEARFRQIETEALRDALETDAGVISLGGGTWTIPGNRTLIREHTSYTVWLDAPFDLCWQRIQPEHNVRPLARDRARARTLYDERRALYRLASLRVEVDSSQSTRTIAGLIVRALTPQTRRT